MKTDIQLQFCSSSNLVFKAFEDRHYVKKMPTFQDLPDLEKQRVSETPEKLAAFIAKSGAPRGHHAQQIHFLIWLRGEIVGAISGGSAVFGTKSRDLFFGLTKDNKKQTLNGVIDNTLFRLERAERNLATRCLALWRRKVVGYWEYMYGVVPYGFETYVEEVEIEERPGKQRVGSIYLADNWTFTCRTFGSTKNHIGVGLTGGVEYDGVKKGSFARTTSIPKLEFCKWRDGFSEAVYCEYQSSWRGKTPEEKLLAKERASRREKCMNTFDVSEVK